MLILCWASCERIGLLVPQRRLWWSSVRGVHC